MSENSQPPSRRGFLMGAAVAAGATAAVAPRMGASAPEVAEVVEPRPMPERGGGYSLSEHVQRYYQTTRV